MTCFSVSTVFKKFTYCIVTTTDTFFYRLGVSIARDPVRTIVLCWIFVLLSSLGFLRFHQEKNPLKLWVPPHSTFVRDSEWLMKTFQRGFSEETITIVTDDVLTPEVIQKVANIHRTVMSAKTENNITMMDVCFRIPKVNKKLLKMLMPNPEEDIDPSKEMQAALYCSFVEAMRTECYTKSILELWDYNMTKIFSLTKDEIVATINTNSNNSIYGKLKNYEDLLGGIVKNDSGHIVQAQAIQNYWMLLVNFSSIDMDVAGNLAGTGEWASEEALDWETTFLKIMENISNHNEGFYYYSGRSFGDISKSSMFQDIDKLCIGVFFMVLYVQYVISKFNWLEARIVLGFAGMMVIGMGFIAGAGLCCMMAVPYGPVHLSLQFLLMGLGVDDMLVIMSCWDDLTDDEQKLPVCERVGLMLKHGGVSITITSFTDVIAFIIGSSTILPCLQSFCIYAAVGVLMTFVFAVTFFTACFVLDQKRLENGRNGIIPCIRHANYKPNECSQSNLTNRFIGFVYSDIILTTPGKIVVILITIVCLGFGIESSMKLEQRFDPKWFLPEGTHLNEYFKTKDQYFLHIGYPVGLYIGSVDYHKELMNIKEAVDGLQNMPGVISGVASWVDPFRNFVKTNFKHDVYSEELDKDRFRLFLSKFLHSPRHAKFQANFVFETDLECGAPAPNIKMSSIDFSIMKMPDPRDHILPMHHVQDIAENMNLTTGDKFATAWSKFFSLWITDEV